jgi:lysophospholipase L1-like esterase
MRNFILPILSLALSIALPDTRAIEIRDGDKILLLGNTFIERAQKYGYIETAITSANPDKKLTFRNIGWSGDTVFGHARSYFGPPQEGFGRLEKLVREEKPTLILLNYGANASFDGESGLPGFIKGFDRLIEMLKKTEARFAVLTPLPQEKLPAPLPDPKAHNRELALYSKALQEWAKGKGIPVIDLFTALGAGKTHIAGAKAPLTDNGLHLEGYGYWAGAETIAGALGHDVKTWSATVEWTRGKTKAQSAKVKSSLTGKSKISLLIEPETLPPPPAPRHTPTALLDAKIRPSLIIRKLPAGTWRLTSKGKVIAKGSSRDWEKGIRLAETPNARQTEELRQVINEKNELFFHKHRPQNETYLFGFRKREQGNNSVEIPKFQPLIEAKEKAIQELLKPRPFTIELTRE